MLRFMLRRRRKDWKAELLRARVREYGIALPDWKVASAQRYAHRSEEVQAAAKALYAQRQSGSVTANAERRDSRPNCVIHLDV
jgi:hypothetical protein